MNKPSSRRRPFPSDFCPHFLTHAHKRRTKGPSTYGPATTIKILGFGNPEKISFPPNFLTARPKKTDVIFLKRCTRLRWPEIQGQSIPVPVSRARILDPALGDRDILGKWAPNLILFLYMSARYISSDLGIRSESMESLATIRVFVTGNWILGPKSYSHLSDFFSFPVPSLSNANCSQRQERSSLVFRPSRQFLRASEFAWTHLCFEKSKI